MSDVVTNETELAQLRGEAFFTVATPVAAAIVAALREVTSNAY